MNTTDELLVEVLGRWNSQQYWKDSPKRELFRCSNGRCYGYMMLPYDLARRAVDLTGNQNHLSEYSERWQAEWIKGFENRLTDMK